MKVKSILLTVLAMATWVIIIILISTGCGCTDRTIGYIEGEVTAIAYKIINGNHTLEIYLADGEMYFVPTYKIRGDVIVGKRITLEKKEKRELWISHGFYYVAHPVVKEIEEKGEKDETAKIS